MTAKRSEAAGQDFHGILSACDPKLPVVIIVMTLVEQPQ
jgi:hypothetical protein